MNAIPTDRFERFLALLAQDEGGFSDHPEDNGGRTMLGVTQRTYDDWRRAQGLAARDVARIEADEVRAIYRDLYWAAVRADELPDGLAYAVADYAVNSGPGRAARELQRVVGAGVDGVVGPRTLTAVRLAVAERGVRALIGDLCDRRLRFMRSLSDWRHFGRGWTARVEGVRIDALAMVDDPMTPSLAPVRAPTPEARPETASPVKAAARDPFAWLGTLSTALAGLGGAVEGPLGYALAICAVLVTLTVCALLVRRSLAS